MIKIAGSRKGMRFFFLELYSIISIKKLKNADRILYKYCIGKKCRQKAATKLDVIIS